MLQNINFLFVSIETFRFQAKDGYEDAREPASFWRGNVIASSFSFDTGVSEDGRRDGNKL